MRETRSGKPTYSGGKTRWIRPSVDVVQLFRRNARRDFAEPAVVMCGVCGMSKPATVGFTTEFWILARKHIHPYSAKTGHPYGDRD